MPRIVFGPSPHAAARIPFETRPPDRCRRAMSGTVPRTAGVARVPGELMKIGPRRNYLGALQGAQRPYPEKREGRVSRRSPRSEGAPQGSAAEWLTNDRPHPTRRFAASRVRARPGRGRPGTCRLLATAAFALVARPCRPRACRDAFRPGRNHRRRHLRHRRRADPPRRDRRAGDEADLHPQRPPLGLRQGRDTDHAPARWPQPGPLRDQRPRPLRFARSPRASRPAGTCSRNSSGRAWRSPAGNTRPAMSRTRMPHGTRAAALRSGEFVEPWRWRKERRGAGSRAGQRPHPARNPGSSCLIKGNISDHGRIYHIPGGYHHERTRIDEAPWRALVLQRGRGPRGRMRRA